MKNSEALELLQCYSYVPSILGIPFSVTRLAKRNSQKLNIIMEELKEIQSSEETDEVKEETWQKYLQSDYTGLEIEKLDEKLVENVENKKITEGITTTLVLDTILEFQEKIKKD